MERYFTAELQDLDPTGEVLVGLQYNGYRLREGVWLLRTSATRAEIERELSLSAGQVCVREISVAEYEASLEKERGLSIPHPGVD